MSILKLAIVNCEQVVTVCSNRELFRVGSKQDQVELFQRDTNSVGCSIVIDCNGTIVAVGQDDCVQQQLSDKFGENWIQCVPNVIDGKGCSVIPGLIDAHTHPVWAGDRVDEFDRKLRGATYMDIHNSGGGIHYTVDRTRNASEQDLLKDLVDRVKLMVSCGTTVLECKTGYGLELQTEVKMLKVIEQARSLVPIELVTNFLGAHSIPK